MKKITIRTLALSLAFLFLLFVPLTVNASPPPMPKGPKGWYVKRQSDHKQPTLEPHFSYIEKYDAYYIDKKHGDDTEEKVLYLTFDAGYENGNIEKILNVLKEEGVFAAFFILDNLIVRNRELVVRMAEEGHLVCNHTLKHKDMTKITDEAAFREELEALERLYTEATGKKMEKYYRPPQGNFNESNLQMAQKLGYKTIFWSFAYADWDNEKQPDPKVAKKKILENTHNGAVILLHPTSETNASILKDLIHEWRKLGYSFGTLNDLTAP